MVTTNFNTIYKTLYSDLSFKNSLSAQLSVKHGAVETVNFGAVPDGKLWIPTKITALQISSGADFTINLTDPSFGRSILISKRLDKYDFDFILSTSESLICTVTNNKSVSSLRPNRISLIKIMISYLEVPSDFLDKDWAYDLIDSILTK